MTPADGIELARQIHARAELYGIGAWTAAVDVLNCGDEADQQRARDLMVFVRHHQQVQAWMDGVNGLPPPDLLPPTPPRPDTGSTVRRGGIPPLSAWLEMLGVLAMFALLWIALAVLT